MLVSIENLRNKAWVEAHGHTVSIMGLCTFDYLARPEGANISSKRIIPTY